MCACDASSAVWDEVFTTHGCCCVSVRPGAGLSINPVWCVLVGMCVWSRERGVCLSGVC